MILDLDKCLEEKLTKDRECTEVYENLKELYLTGTVETRHYGEEREIKLNRLERKETPMQCRRNNKIDDSTYYCPICSTRFDTWVQVTNYCTKCGQRLKL